MHPTVLSYTELDPAFVHEEIAKMNHDIDLDNESRALVDKAPLPHLVYGSKAQLTDEVIAKAEEDIKAELTAEHKPEKKFGTRLSQVRWLASWLITQRLTKNTHSLRNFM